jgi:hypothetical protein
MNEDVIKTLAEELNDDGTKWIDFKYEREGEVTRIKLKTSKLSPQKAYIIGFIFGAFASFIVMFLSSGVHL